MKKLRRFTEVKLSDGSLLSEVFNGRLLSKGFNSRSISKVFNTHNEVLNFENEDFSLVDFSKQKLKDLHFKDCNFSHCDFTKTSIEFSNFSESNLTKANFTKARLHFNRFYQSNLTDVNFEDVTISNYSIYYLLNNNSNLTNLNVDQLTGGMKVPFVKDLHKKVYQSICESGEFLEMNRWHRSCGTTHCRGGWAIHHAGKAGYELEKKLESLTAAALIYQKSTGMIPYFHSSNEQALADIKRCASL